MASSSHPPPSSSPSSSSPYPDDPPVALVTAGSAGLGAAVAELFARSGMRVVINYHGNAQRADDLVTRLRDVTALVPRPGRLDYHAVRADLSVRADVERLVAEAVAALWPEGEGEGEGQRPRPRLDVVFSNGGWTRMRDITDLDDNLDDEDWDRCFAMNVKSHLWLMHAARPYLEAAHDEGRGAASFITTASLAGVKVSGSSLAYSVTKAAQLHLAKGLAQIAAPKVRVNSVSPGLLLTEWGLRFPPERINAMMEASRLKRIATVEDVAQQVLAFVTMKSVSGQNMVLDGGFGMPW